MMDQDRARLARSQESLEQEAKERRKEVRMVGLQEAVREYNKIQEVRKGAQKEQDVARTTKIPYVGNDLQNEEAQKPKKILDSRSGVEGLGGINIPDKEQTYETTVNIQTIKTHNTNIEDVELAGNQMMEEEVGGTRLGVVEEVVGRDQPRSNFQRRQLVQLRGQIMAYRLLARYQPLPPKVAVVAVVAGTGAGAQARAQARVRIGAMRKVQQHTEVIDIVDDDETSENETTVYQTKKRKISSESVVNTERQTNEVGQFDNADIEIGEIGEIEIGEIEIGERMNRKRNLEPDEEEGRKRRRPSDIQYSFLLVESIINSIIDSL